MNTISHTPLYAAIGLVMAIAALSALSTTAAVANTDVQTMKVQIDDLDLSRSPGARTLYRRITSAARLVCGTNTCIEQAIDRAVKQVNAPTLTRLRFGADVKLAKQ